MKTSLALATLLTIATPSFATAAETKAAASTFALPFIHDDYAAALAKAKAQKRPIFVEAWAPW